MVSSTMKTSLIVLASLAIISLFILAFYTPTKTETKATISTSSASEGVNIASTSLGIISLSTTATPPPPPHSYDTDRTLARQTLTIEKKVVSMMNDDDAGEPEPSAVQRCRRFPFSNTADCTVSVALSGTGLELEQDLNHFLVSTWQQRLDWFTANQLVPSSDLFFTRGDFFVSEELAKVYQFLYCLRRHSNNLIQGEDARLKKCIIVIDAHKRVKRI